MKRVLIAAALAFAAAAPAMAADMPPPGPPPGLPPTYMPAPVPLYNWTGFYAGINGGYASGTSNWTDVGLAGLFGIPAATGDFNASGFLFGGTVGANYQLGSIVYGVEADADWSNLDGSTSNLCGPNCETRSDWLATVRGRLGYAWDRIMVYTTAGLALADVDAGLSGGPFSSSTQVGWTAGVGVEAAFAPNWTAKVEYLFVDLANTSCGTACDPFYGTTTSVSLNENIVRAGINYKFGWGGPGGWER